MIYFDNAATTPVCEAAKRAVMNHIDEFGNPSSAYRYGRDAKQLIKQARQDIADCINARPEEIYFTSCGSEADTWALEMKSYTSIVASPIEHAAILMNPLVDKKMPVHKFGIVDYNNIPSVDYALYSCMLVNNELGTIQPIKEIAQFAHSNNSLIHTDAVQAVGHIPIDVQDLNVDCLSASAHKFNGLKGTGFLYIKDDTYMFPLIRGGKQERGLRGGTENVLGIVAMAEALKWNTDNMHEHTKTYKELNRKLFDWVGSVCDVTTNCETYSVPYIISLTIPHVSAEQLVALCDENNICISSGSACHENTNTPSHVLKAIGLSDENASNTIRISFGYQNTVKEVEEFTTILPTLIKMLRW